MAVCSGVRVQCAIMDCLCVFGAVSCHACGSGGVECVQSVVKRLAHEKSGCINL